MGLLMRASHRSRSRGQARKVSQGHEAAYTGRGRAAAVGEMGEGRMWRARRVPGECGQGLSPAGGLSLGSWGPFPVRWQALGDVWFSRRPGPPEGS